MKVVSVNFARRYFYFLSQNSEESDAACAKEKSLETLDALGFCWVCSLEKQGLLQEFQGFLPSSEMESRSEGFRRFVAWPKRNGVCPERAEKSFESLIDDFSFRIIFDMHHVMNRKFDEKMTCCIINAGHSNISQFLYHQMCTT